MNFPQMFGHKDGDRWQNLKNHPLDGAQYHSDLIRIKIRPNFFYTQLHIVMASLNENISKSLI
jgi:hypothetical protein